MGSYKRILGSLFRRKSRRKGLNSLLLFRQAKAANFLAQKLSKLSPARILTVGPGFPIPLIYGRVKVGGQIIEATLSGKQVLGEQRFRFVVALGFGPIHRIGDKVFGDTDINAFGNNLSTLEIDSNDSNTFNDLNLSVRFGTLTQDELSNSHGNVGTQLFSVSLLPSLLVVSFTTTNEVAFVQFNIRFNGGIFDNHPSGPLTIKSSYQYRYKATGSPTFSLWVDFDIEALARDNFTATVKSVALVRDQYDFELRHIGTTPSGLAVGSLHSPVLDSLDEFGGTPIAYAKIALIDLEGLVTQEINSESAKTVEVLCDGRRIDTWTGTVFINQFSQNPAWVALDILRNSIFGLGDFFSTSNIDLDSFLTWANYNDEIVDGLARNVFNHTFNGGDSVYGTFIDICTMGQAAPRFSNGVVSIVIDRLRNPISLVGQGVIKDGTLKIGFRSRAETYDAVTLRFDDENRDFEEETARAANSVPKSPSRYRELNIERVGITEKKQALREVNLELRRSNLVKISISFEMSLDGFSLLPGDVFEFSHDSPGYGQSGRIISDGVNIASRTDLIFDRDLIIIGGESVIIQDIDTDTLETQLVTSTTGSYPAGTIISTGQFSFIPQRASQYAYGVPPSKPFEVTSIDLTADFELSVQAEEYIPAVYDDTVVTQPVVYSRLGRSGKTPLDVITLSATNVSRTRQDGFIFSTLEVNWQFATIDFINGAPAPTRAEVYFRVLGFNFWQQVGTVGFPGTSYTLLTELNPGTTYEFAVVPVSIRGNKKNPNQVNRVAQTYTGLSNRPDPVTNFVVTYPTPGNMQMDWTRVADETLVDYYEIRYGHGWDGARVIARVLAGTFSFQEFGIETGEQSYEQSYDPNLEIPVRNRVHIRARNFAGAYSSQVATDTSVSSTQIAGSIVLSDSPQVNDWAGYTSDGLTFGGLFKNRYIFDDTFPFVHPGWASLVSPIFDRPGGVSKIIRINPRILLRRLEKDWTAATYLWSDIEADSESWDGTIDDEDMVVQMKIRRSNVIADIQNDVTPWEDGYYLAGVTERYIQYQLFITIAVVFPFASPRIENCFFTIEE